MACMSWNLLSNTQKLLYEPEEESLGIKNRLSSVKEQWI